MNQKLLLPHKYKKFGWIILVPSAILGIIYSLTGFQEPGIKSKVFALWYEEIFKDNQSFSIITTDVTNTVLGVLIITGGLLVAFSKEKVEDEFISNLRLTSLLWAVLINYLLLLFCFLFIYGLSFMNVMAFNMFTTLAIFIARFHFVLYKNNHLTDEKYHQGSKSIA